MRLKRDYHHQKETILTRLITYQEKDGVVLVTNLKDKIYILNKLIPYGVSSHRGLALLEDAVLIEQ
jgi:hypothetical protein